MFKMGMEKNERERAKKIPTNGAKAPGGPRG